jgi:hypothetical protein
MYERKIPTKPFAAMLQEGTRLIALRASPLESVRHTGARGSNCRDEELVDVLDTEWRKDEFEGCFFH